MEQKEKEFNEQPLGPDGGDEGEINFKNVLQFLKKSLVRMAIYLLVALTLVTAVFLGFRFFARTDYSVSTMVEFTHPGVSEGRFPDGSGFNKESIRSAEYVSKALEDSALIDTVTGAGYDVDSVRNRISVDGVMPDAYIAKYNELIAGGMSSADAYAQLAQMVFYPTKYVVSFRDFEPLKFKNSDAVKLLDELIVVYTDAFLKKYSTSMVISSAEFEAESELYDYIDYYNIFSTKYESINSYLTRMNASNPGFVSNASGGKSFGDLLSDLSFMQTQLDTLKVLVDEKYVSNNIESMKTSVNNKIRQLTREQTRVTELIANIEQQLEKFQPSTTTQVPAGSSNQTIITTTWPKEYYDLQNKLTSYYMQSAQIRVDLEEQQEIYAKIKDLNQNQVSDQDRILADSVLSTLRKSSKEFISSVNAATAEYTRITITENSLKTVSPPTYTTQSAEFPTVLSYLLAVLIAIVAALIVTGIKVKAAEKRRLAQSQEQGLPGGEKE